VTEPGIVHLGPIQNFNSTTIRSTKLVLATYRRVRAVQRIMGYASLIAAPDGAEGSIDDVRVWSRETALNEIQREAVDLMEEFASQDDE